MGTPWGDMSQQLGLLSLPHKANLSVSLGWGWSRESESELESELGLGPGLESEREPKLESKPTLVA